MSETYRVVLTDYIDDDLEPERKALNDVARVEALCAHHEDELLGRVEDADALVVFHEISVSRKIIDRLERCRVIVRAGAGFDNVDGAAARQRGIPFCNVPDYGSEEVADSAIALTLSLTRGTHLANSKLRDSQGSWSYRDVVPLGRLRGRVFGVVGLGRIGSAAALRAKMLGMDVVFHDPYKPDGYDKALGIRRVETLDELLAQSYVVSLHCPLGDETRHLIDAAAMARMPKGSYLVNTARGAVVDTAALPDAMASGWLAGAGIDVVEQEPPAADHPLMAAWRDPEHPAHHRLIVNPHIAFYSEEGLLDMRVKSVEACRRALLGLPLRNVVN
ncbi:MAG: C-terminal binding protein [Thermoguttaceae bacterium]|jgi:D-3-phosphoglycerate dehydrogenase/C-terminal binding protein|nr:C-terminal binding protein [Thermoguttaceae bacterium]